MLGDRIKLKRNANRMSLQELEHSLKEAGCEITYATLSNYENNKTVPSPAILEILADRLGVTTAFFFDEQFDDLQPVCFHDIHSVSKNETELMAYLKVRLEQHLSLDRLLGISFVPPSPRVAQLQTFDEKQAEQTANAFRNVYHAGKGPIHSICHLLEDNGWYVFELPSSFGFDALSGYVPETGHHFLSFKSNDRADELRYHMLYAVGEAFFSGEDPDSLEQTLSAFASAVLLPSQQAKAETGTGRTDISFVELTILKRKYGLSRLRIAKRLNALHLFPTENYHELLATLRKHGYPLNRGLQTDTLPFSEIPEALKQKVLRAHAAGLLSREDMLLYYPFHFFDT